MRSRRTLAQVRGREGVRVREAYAKAAALHGVDWSGRVYDRAAWNSADPVNRALSVANSCLYGLCHAVIAACGFSPGLGFIHSGYGLAFVHDIADLYKMDVCVPLAFAAAAGPESKLEAQVRRTCRDRFFEMRILERIVPDTQRVLGLKPMPAQQVVVKEVLDGALWGPGDQQGAMGISWADGPEES